MGNRTTDLVVVQGNIIAQRYVVDVLNAYALPSIRQHGPGLTLMHDNARPHVDRVTTQFLQQNNVNVMPWPAVSPDLNPIEHIWDQLGRKARANHQIDNVRDLTRALQQEWRNALIMDRAPNLDTLLEMDIINRYRFDRAGINYLTQLIGANISPKAARNNALYPEQKILIKLRYLATGLIQLNDADIHGVSQPTVSRVLTEVINALSSPALIRQFIKFPGSVEEFRQNAVQMQGIARFPKVIGAIDGTHINIASPNQHEEIYVNRKGKHSINVQVVFDGWYTIIDVVARWPGSVHDRRVLRESSLNNLFENGHMPHGFHLLWDSGYPAKRWLLTPFLAPQTQAEQAYNRSHKVTRALVERGIGQLKRRFGILHREAILQLKCAGEL
ncbi:putative nuclease HARBI1 [Mya arenaria]|uniref:putative nuclease HARBI1 n=1 Tax=Mya arenaria TaxID=6604 RepID=UPI0022DECDC3|nr:putative nuclease HARBI1 [Mya arenaria]